MITLEQARKIVDIGEDLTRELSTVDANLAAFRSLEADTVECRAYASVSYEFGRKAAAYATLLPVPKSVAISALERERSKVIAKLAELGVDVFSTESQAPDFIRATEFVGCLAVAAEMRK